MVRSTSDLFADADEKVWDAIIIGAGPAGATAAYLLANHGRTVLLIEKKKFPRDKVCGCCLSGRAVTLLHDNGLADVLTDSLPCNHFIMGVNQSQLRVSTSNGLTISRRTLDQRLVERAIQAGATYLDETTATIKQANNAFRKVEISHLDRKLTVRAKIVLACGGLGQNLGAMKSDEHIEPNNKVGFAAILPNSADYDSETIYMALGSSGYVGLKSLEDGRMNLAAAIKASHIKKEKGCSSIVERLIEQAGFPEVAGMAKADWVGTPLLTRQRERLADDRVFVLGDAAGYVEPFTGEGMAWAFSSAVAGLPLFLSAINQWQPSLSDEWRTTYKKVVVKEQRVIRFLKMAANYPKLTSRTFSLLKHFPYLTSPIVRSIHGVSNTRQTSL